MLYGALPHTDIAYKQRLTYKRPRTIELEPLGDKPVAEIVHFNIALTCEVNFILRMIKE